MSLARPASRLRESLTAGRVDVAAGLLEELVGDGTDVASLLREAAGCSPADVAWVAPWNQDPGLLDREDVELLLAFLVRRQGRLRVAPPAGSPLKSAADLEDDPANRYPAVRGVAWSPAERRFLLARWGEDRDAFRGTTGADAGRHERRRTLWRQLYIDGTPLVVLARHPATHAIVRHSFDPYGVDGPWWNVDTRHRPDGPDVAGWLGATGGIVRGPRPDGGAALRWLLSPVSQRLLDAGATGVMRRLVSATTTCDVVAWFDLEDREVEPAPDLGQATATVRGADGTFRGYVDVAPLDPRDDVAEAIGSGRLRWITPGDDDHVLRTGLDNCPFVDTDGRWVGAGR